MIQQDFSTEATATTRGRISSTEDQSHPYEVSLIEVLTQLAYQKLLIAKVAGAVILIGLVISFVLPVRYTATVKIMPPQQTQSAASVLMNQLAGGNGGSLAAIAGGGLGLKSPNDIYIGLLQSRTEADAIIKKFSLSEVYHAKDMTDARKKLARNTEVTSDKSEFITVSVSDKDKKRAAAMANAYIDELRTLTNTFAVTEASQRRLFYEQQLKQTNETLVAAELAFQQIQQQKGLVQLGAQTSAMITGLSTLRAQVAAKQVQLQALRSYSTEQNPDVQLVERELASLQSEEASLEHRSPSPGIAEMGLENIPSAGLEYLRAEHEVQFQQALYDMLLKQYDAAKLDEAKQGAVIQVVEPAIEPDRKSYPHRALILLLSAFLGVFAGCFLALFLWWKELVQSAPDAAQQLHHLKQAVMSRGSRNT